MQVMHDDDNNIIICNPSSGFFIIMSPAEGLHFSALVSTVITCPPLNDPTNGTVTYNVKSSNLEFGKQAIYNCNTGFALVGNTTRTCTGDGSSTTGAFDGGTSTCEGESPICILFPGKDCGL